MLIESIPSPVLRAHAAGVALPAGFDVWFGGCVVRDVTLRFQHVRDAWAELRKVLLAPPDERPVTPPQERPDPPLPAPGSTKRWLVIAGSVALTAGLLGVVVAAVRGDVARAGEAGIASVSAPSSTPATEESVLFAPVSVDSAPVVVDAGDPVLAAVMSCLATNDLACAHATLEPVVAAKTAAAYHVQLLYDLCELEADRECMASIAKQHPKVARGPQRVRTLSAPGLAGGVPDAGGTVADQARALLLTDKAGARSLLEPLVFRRKATPEEAQMLYGICKEQRDSVCRSAITHEYPSVH